ncbi:YadA-like family protein [Actinobacillus pleuropneumoniae]|uniref:YadA-like family protein n=1 Tax=Actinobacillus pleuropneumoniae TaxID=715 RepID=UPI003F7B79B3
MNKIFKVIWSHATQTFVVVSELTRSKSKAKASVSDVKKNEVSSLITSGFKLSAISALLISTIPTAYAAVAINQANLNTAIPNVPTEGKVDANGTQSIAIGVNAGKQRPDGDKGSDGDNNTDHTDNDYEKLSTRYLSDNTRQKNNLISMGTYAFAGGHDSIAIGTNAQAVYENNFQQGNASRTNNSKHSNNGGAVAIGFQAISRGDQSVALGSRAAARNRQSVAIGNDSFASGVGSVVIGGDDSSYVPGSTFLKGSTDYGGYKIEKIGFNPNPDPNYSLWYRPSAASGNGATVVGVHSQALSKGSTAVGVAATSGDGGKTSLVRDDTVEGGIKGIDPNQNIEATAVGALAHARNRNTTAVGHAAKAYSDYSTSIGDDAVAEGKNSSAVGKSSYAKGDYSVAIGNAENTTNTASVNATKVIANGLRAIAIGTTARTNADDTIAFGTRTESTAGGAISIGYEAKSKALDAIAIGKGAKALNTNTISIGTGNTVNGANSGAIGDPTVVNGTNSYSVGNNNVLASDNTFVLGNSVTLNTNAKNSTVIGNRNTITLTDPQNNTGFVNVQGDHNTINAARGIGILGNENTVDGVTHDVFILGNNVKKTANDSVFLGSGSGYVAEDTTTKGLSKTYTSDTVNGKTVNFAGGEVTAGVVSVGGVNEKGEKSTRRIQNVAPGLISDKSTDAINGSQLYAVAEALKTTIPETKWNIKENATQKDEVKSGDNVSFSDGTGTTANVTVSQDGTTSTVKYSVNKSTLNVAADGTVTAANAGDNFATADQVAQAINNSEKTTAINNSTTITAKPTTVGTVTTYDLDLTQETKDKIQQGIDANTTVNTKGLTFTADSGKETLRKLGETLAINGDKTLINTTVEAGKVSVAATKKLQDAVVSAESALQEIVTTADGKKAQTVKKGSNEANFVSGKNIALTPSDKGITVATQENVDFTTVNATTVNGNTIKSGNVVINQDGINAGDKKITHVADGNVTNDSKEAVNGSQLYATNQNVTNNTNNIAKNTADIAKGTVYAGDYAKDDSVKNEFTQALGNQTNVVGGASKDDLSDKNIGVVSNGANTLTVKLAKTLEGLTSAAFGNDANDHTVINKDGVTITNSTDPNKTVSLTDGGLNNGGNKITNVAEGKAGTDAVNVDQLTKAITDSAYNWNISDGTNNTAVPDSGTVAVKGSANADSANTVGVVTELEGTNVKVDLSQKAKDDIANGQKHSSVNGDTNVLVEVNKTPNAEGGKQYDVKLADTVVVGKDKPVTIDGTNGTVSGLTNTTWDPDTKYEGGKAATQEQLKSVSDVAQKGWNIQANKDTATKVAPGDTVKFIDGENIKVTRAGNEITIATAKDVKFDSVKVGDKVTINNDSINAGDTKVTNVTNGTLAADSKDAVNGSQLYATNQNVTNNAANITKNADNIAKGTVYAGDRLDAAVTGKTNNFTRALGEQTNVVGGATGELSDNNLAVISNGTDTLTVKLAKSLTDLTNATFGSTDMDKTVINKDGVTISSDKSEKTVSLTDKGLNNGNNQITNVTSGLTDSTGQKSDLANATTTNAVNVGDLKDTVNNLTNATTGGFGLKDDNNTEVKQDLGKTIQIKGKDGVTVTSNVADKSLEVALQGDVTVNGKDGKDGSIGVKGADGKDGTKITKDAVVFNGVDGKDGKDGQVSIKVEQGEKGIVGNDGANGTTKTRIVYEKPNGDKEQVATLNDGLNFVGDKGQVIQKKLNETLAIKGNLDANATVTDKNLRVDNDKDQNGELIIKMAKSLTDLTNATFSSGDINATIGGNGLTITPKGGDVVSLTDKGLNNGNNTITNVAPGVNGTDAVNKGQLDGVNATANAGWNLTTNGDNTNASNVAPNSTVDLANTDGNIVITKAGNNVTFDLNNNLTVGGPGKDGKDGVDGQLGVQGKDGKTGVTLNGKDGAIGINGKDGSNGSITVKQGKPGVDGKDGETKTRIVYEIKDETGKPTTEEVATLNDGLKFVGDTGEVIAKKLNETLAIKGNLTATAAVTDKNLRVDNENGQLIVKMAKSLTDLTNATFGSDNSNTTIGGNGVTITPNGGDAGNTVSLTDKGLNNGNNQVTNVSTGLKDRNGNNVTLANASGDVLNNAVNVGDLKDSVNNLTNATTGGFGLTDEKGNDVKADLGKTVTVQGDGSVKTEVVEKDGKKALQIGLTNNVTVGNDKEPGTITVKGENGKDGVSISGKDGIGIKGENGQDAVSINGKGGNGAIAVNGKDGKTGVGLDGANGTIGINGKDGSNGTITLAKGEPGVDGKDGKTRIVYETKTPDGKTVTEEVATLKDGLNFVGDKGKVIAKKLNETLTIKGNLSTAADVTDKNLRVDNVDNALIIKMARTLTDLTSATFTNAGGDKSVVDGNGLTITPTKGGNTVSLTTSGLDNGGNKVINVAAGDVNANSTDAVNGSQLYAVSEVANKGWNIQTNGNDTTNVKPGDTVNFVNGDNIAITNDGTKVTVGLVKNVDLGEDGSIKAGDTFVNKDGVKVGDNVSLTKDGLTAGDVKISATTGINAGDKQITNVASGLGGKKLSEAEGDTLTNAANIGDLQTAVSSVTDASQGGGFGLADDKGANVTQNLGKTIAVKGDGKNISTVVKGGALTVNLNKDVDLGKDGSLTIGNTTINSDQVKVGDVTVSSNGKVSGVADGDISPNSTEAINGSQLYDANQNIANYLGGGSKLDDKGNVIAPTYTITKVDGNTTTANNVGDAITNLNNEVVKPLTFAGDTGAASKRKLGSTVTIKGGVQDSSKLSENNIGVVSDGKGTLAVKLAKDIKVDSVEAKTVNANTVNANTVKAGDTTINSDGVTIKDGPSVTKSGINAAGNRITNVKAGQADTDAVNVSQLKGAVGHVNQRINKVNKDLRAGIAGANAAAGLPQAYMPGKSMMAVAAGTYKNESALAVGYSRSSDNGKVILKLQGNANTRGDLGGSVGVGYQW